MLSSASFVLRSLGRRYASTWAHISNNLKLTAKDAIEVHKRRSELGENVKNNTMLVVQNGSVELGKGDFAKCTKNVAYLRKIKTTKNHMGGYDVTESGGGSARMEFWRKGGEARCHYNPKDDVSNIDE